MSPLQNANFGHEEDGADDADEREEGWETVWLEEGQLEEVEINLYRGREDTTPGTWEAIL